MSQPPYRSLAPDTKPPSPLHKTTKTLLNHLIFLDHVTGNSIMFHGTFDCARDRLEPTGSGRVVVTFSLGASANRIIMLSIDTFRSDLPEPVTMRWRFQCTSITLHSALASALKAILVASRFETETKASIHLRSFSVWRVASVKL